MPRAIDKDLRDCLERANPYTEYRIEISQPDVGQVLRRTDQFTQAPSLVSMTPAASLAASPRGALILAPTTAALQSFAGVLSSYDLNGENSARRVKGVAWTMDKAFSRCTVKSISAKVERVPLAGAFFEADIECQIFRITKTPGVKIKNPGTPQYQSIAWTEYTFTPLLSPAPTLKASAQAWDGANRATLSFDLTNWNLTLDNSPAKAVTPDQVGELPEYFIVVRLAGKPPAGTGHYKWLLDTASARTIANIGTFERTWWARNSDSDQWVRTAFADVPNFAINVDTYPATGQAVYLIDQGKAPGAASTGRVDFQRVLPPGTSAIAEISATGAGGPFTTVRHGDKLNGINYVTQPEQLDQAAWVKTATGAGVLPVVTPDAGVDPFGSLTADKVVFSSPAGAGDQSTLNQDGLYAITAAARYTGSWYVKAFAAGDVGKQIVMRAAGRAGYTLITLTADWQRVQASELAFNALSYVEIGMRPGASGVGGSTGAVSVFLWHAQLEPGAVATAPAVMLPVQQTYHLRASLFADTALKATPQVNSLGVEFRIPQDVSVEGIPDLPTREVDLPWLKAAIPEGKIKVVRTGIRDFLDVATVLGSTAAAPRLEADIYLASRHPSITREKWFRLERMMVTNRLPSATSEEFTLLSYASRLKRKIPQKVETINSVHVVQAGTTAAQVIVSPVLPGTSVAGNEYDGKGYYMRVRSTAAPNTPAGLPVTIQGNTATDRLDFAPSMTESLVAGDVVEVHSGIFQTAPVSWVDADPADVWDSVLSLLGIPPERIGAGWLPRGGKPPRVTDIAPGDPTTQAKRKITGQLSEEEAGDELLDQISTILGGVTFEKDGQILYVQIIPLVDIAGNITVPLPPPAAVFDMRDLSSLSTPPGLERRATIVSCAYGVPATAADPNAFPSKTTTSVDGDALLWLAQQDLEDYGTADVPDNIARWLYNSADAGLYLASVLSTQLVKVASTGLRVFPAAMAEKHPELVIGDVVIIATDQYTDYEPSTQTALAGPMAIRGVVVREGREGRDLAIFVPGLIDNVQLVKGGGAGALLGLGTKPAGPSIDGSFSATGELILDSIGDSVTASQKVVASLTHQPTDVEVRASAPILLQALIAFATGVIAKPGHPIWVSAFGYTATGLESPIALFQLTREGGAFDAHGKTPFPLGEEEHHRGGNGGIPIPGGRIHAISTFDDTGSIPLVDTHGRQVGPLLKANDGEPGVESQRAATRKAAQAAGSGAGGITEEEHHKAGNGGIPVPSGRIHAIPVFDDTGSFPLLDTHGRQVGPLLKANDGEPGVESQRAASRKAAQAVGHGAQGMTEEERHRTGNGGIPVPSGRIHTLPQFDNTGSIPLTDPTLRKILAAFGMDQSTSLNGQGSIIPAPTDGGSFAYNSGGPATGKMWISWTWAAFTLWRSDGTTISVPASSSLPVPPSPTLSQIGGGPAGARTVFVRIGYLKNRMIFRVGPEASLAVLAGNQIKVTSPAAVAGYDGWVALVGTASNGEFIQVDQLFGNDYLEGGTGFNSTTTTPYDNTFMPTGVTSQALNVSQSYNFYQWYDLALGFVAFASRGSIGKSFADAQAQNLDGRVALQVGPMAGVTPAAGLTGSGGTLGGGKFG